MSKISASSDIAQVKPEDVQRFVDIFCQDVADTVNGKLDFSSNFACKLVTAVFPTANTQLAISHGLGRTPAGYIVTSSSVASGLYNGTSSNSASTLYLMASVAGTFGLVVF